MTSHDVVARVRRLAGTRKVGHAGTLDPMATGVLRASASTGPPGCSATSRSPRRRTTPRCGSASHHHRRRRGRDARRPRRPARSTRTTSARRPAAFVGDIEQVPSAVSAIKVDGKRAYARVRDGEEVELPARPVTVHELLVTDVRPRPATRWTSTSRCGARSGTYIRAIARDLGAALGVGGHLTALRRTAVGPVRPRRRAHPRRAGRVVRARGDRRRGPALLPAVDLDEEQARDVRLRAQARSTSLDASGPVAVFDPAGTFLALYERRGELAAPVAVFV